MLSFLHTADWQIGKPFQGIADPTKRERLRQQRLDTVRSLRGVIDEHSLAFVVLCGDLFDSATPDNTTVSNACAVIGSLGAPVYVIPGNHDHGGPGGIWEQDFFRREREALAPNLEVLLSPEPVILERAVLLPCPLLRRHETRDPTAWLRTAPEGLPQDRPRIVLAHGGAQGFSSAGDADQEAAINQIDLERLPAGNYDYVALGDWHGYKQAGARAWYSGAPEPDRFPKGGANRPGHVLRVRLPARGAEPEVTAVPTGKIGWRDLGRFTCAGDDDLDLLEQQLGALLGDRVNQDLLNLEIAGTLSLSGAERLDALLGQLGARLIRLRVEKDIVIDMTDGELDALTQRPDPLIAQVARDLRDRLDEDPVNRDLLRELHWQIRQVSS